MYNSFEPQLDEENCNVLSGRNGKVTKTSVDHPDHYGGDTTYEAIKVIEAWELGFCLGNTVKYVARARHKGKELEDLKKARWYLDRKIQQMEEG